MLSARLGIPPPPSPPKHVHHHQNEPCEHPGAGCPITAPSTAGLCVGCAVLRKRCDGNSITYGCLCCCHVSWRRPSKAALHQQTRAGSMGHQLLAKQAANKPEVGSLQPGGRTGTYMGLMRLFDPPGCLPPRTLRRRIKHLRNHNQQQAVHVSTACRPPPAHHLGRRTTAARLEHSMHCCHHNPCCRTRSGSGWMLSGLVIPRCCLNSSTARWQPARCTQQQNQGMQPRAMADNGRLANASHAAPTIPCPACEGAIVVNVNQTPRRHTVVQCFQGIPCRHIAANKRGRHGNSGVAPHTCNQAAQRLNCRGRAQAFHCNHLAVL